MENRYEELFQKLSRLQWLLQRNHMQNHSTHGPFADPSRGQGRVLAMLKLQPEISTKDLSYLLGIRQQSLNELLNKLEKSGYVTREPAPEDRRVMMVQLTEKGKNEEQKDTDSTDIFDCLSEDEQSAFSDYLDRVIAALEARLGTDDDEKMADWSKAAKERMGDEMFEMLMAKRGRMPGGHGFGGGFGGGPHHGRGPHGPGHHRPDHHPEPHHPEPNRPEPHHPEQPRELPQPEPEWDNNPADGE